MSFRDVIDELPDVLAQEARLVADSANDVEKESEQWVPYQGPQGGEGWQNAETGEVRYQDQKPTPVDSSTEDMLDSGENTDPGTRELRSVYDENDKPSVNPERVNLDLKQGDVGFFDLEPGDVVEWEDPKYERLTTNIIGDSYDPLDSSVQFSNGVSLSFDYFNQHVDSFLVNPRDKVSTSVEEDDADEEDTEGGETPSGSTTGEETQTGEESTSGEADRESNTEDPDISPDQDGNPVNVVDVDNLSVGDEVYFGFGDNYKRSTSIAEITSPEDGKGEIIFTNDESIGIDLLEEVGLAQPGGLTDSAIQWQEGEAPEEAQGSPVEEVQEESESVYPVDGYESPSEEIRDREFRSSQTHQGLENYESARRIADNISTEELADFVESRMDSYILQYASDDNEHGLWWGVLAARQDSDYDISDVVEIKNFRGGSGDDMEYEVDDAVFELQRAMSTSMDPLQAGKAIHATSGINITNLTGNTRGAFNSTTGILELDEQNFEYQPSISTHEFGHAWQYGSGINSSFRNNRGVNPENWRVNFSSAVGSPERTNDMIDRLRTEFERYRQRAIDYGEVASEVDSYQRTNGSEFLAVTFNHYFEDTASLRDTHPELELFYEEYVGGGVETEEADIIGFGDQGDNPDIESLDVTAGDRVTVRRTEDATGDILQSDLLNAEIVDITRGDSGVVYEFDLGPQSPSIREDEIASIEKLTSLPDRVW